MAFSLSSWFKGKPEDGSPESQVENGEAPPPAAVVTEQNGAHNPPGRVTARVTARVVRTVSPQTAQPASLRAPSARQAISLPLSPGGETQESGGRVSPVLPPSRKISFGTSSDPLIGPFNEPPRVEPAASAPAPTGPDVKVILEVGDFVDRLPSSFLQTGTLDRQRKVEFRSSELYSDLTRGRASVPASIIYQKCADIFSRPVSATEDIEVALPLQKLVEQMSGNFQPRQDQVAVENVGEIETPFLQVAQEDNARLPKAAGTSAGPIAAPKSVAPAPGPQGPTFREHHPTGPISTITPAKGVAESLPPSALGGQPAGAPMNFKRPPSTVRATVAGAKIRVSGPTSANRMKPAGQVPGSGAGSAEAAGASSSVLPVNPAMPGPAASSPSHQVAKKTARIQIPPIALRPAGAPVKAGAPAPPAVPAPGGAATLRPVPNVEAAPTFRSTPGIGSPGAATFRSTPPPPPAAKPPAIKPPPPSFSPRLTNLVPPASPAPLPPILGTSETPSGATAPLTASPAPLPDSREITLKLGPILRGVPSSLLTGDAADVPEDASIALPFRLIEPQLSSGRVAIAFAVFREALPPEHRGLLAAEADQTELLLPLQEIFQNLPSSALSIRADQVVEETSAAYLTPFSQKAEEDAKRFGVGDTAVPVQDAIAPVAAPEPAPTLQAESAAAPVDAAPARAEEVSEVPVPVMMVAEEVSAQILEAEVSAPELPLAVPMPDEVPAQTPALAAAPAEVKPVTVAGNGAAGSMATPPPVAATETPLQKLFMTEDELDAKTVVKLVSQLPGIDGCTVMFGDGLRLAGNFPENGHAEGFSAMSPPFYKRTMNFASECKLGELQACTIYTDTGLLSFFMHNDICMSVRHAGRGFLPGVREKLETVTRELALMYTAAPASSLI